MVERLPVFYKHRAARFYPGGWRSSFFLCALPGLSLALRWVCSSSTPHSALPSAAFDSLPTPHHCPRGQLARLPRPQAGASRCPPSCCGCRLR